MTHRLARLLNEPVMGFLALAALVFGVVPELFDVGPRVHALLTTCEWVVVGLFALEYAAHWRLARDKRAFMLDPWRILDLVIIAAPFVSLIPGSPEAVRSSPFLRVLRLARAIIAGTRASARLRHGEAAAEARAVPQGPPLVARLHADDPAARPLQWGELLEWLDAPKGWVHASNLEPARIEELARATRLTRTLIDGSLGAASFPRLETGARWVALSLGLPRDDGSREPLLLLASGDAVLSLSLFRSELQAHARPLPGAPGAFPLRVVLGIVRLALARHEELAGRTEREVRMLEELAADESPSGFFERVFVLRRRISMSKADLWRLRGILRSVAEGRRALPGAAEEQREDLGRVAEEADYLHETADGLRESLLSLLDLHLNVSGYGMNRFMRLLAIVSALALVPAVVGGLMGMNLVDNPWPATLAQVAFGVFIVMVGMLYTFLAKGWLK